MTDILTYPLSIALSFIGYGMFCNHLLSLVLLPYVRYSGLRLALWTKPNRSDFGPARMGVTAILPERTSSLLPSPSSSARGSLYLTVRLRLHRLP